MYFPTEGMALLIRLEAQPHLSTRQYARIVHGWVESAGLDSSAYGTHSMRRESTASPLC
jgi:hypothetical protein